MLCSFIIGITKAALNNPSFISAASFKKQQEFLLRRQLKEELIG
jgi:hypothetical protein